MDIFWRKLDNRTPTLAEEDKIDVKGQMGMVAEEIEAQPTEVQKSLMKKVWSIILPSKSSKKTPLVQTDTRGRPNLKKQQQKEKEEAAKRTSFEESQYSTFEPSRHSSFIKSDVKPPKPAMQRSRSTSSRVKKTNAETSQEHLGFPSIVGEENENNIQRFKGFIPKIFHTYIEHIQDVLPDGNCGFRAIAVGLGSDEYSWLDVRQQLILELDINARFYIPMFDTIETGAYASLRNRINWTYLAPAPYQHWMLMPEVGLLVAQRYGVIVQFLSNQGCLTIFPLWTGPNTCLPHRVVSIVHIPQHFIHVKLQGDCPMPPTPVLWKRYRNDVAGEWEDVYQSRLQDFLSLHDTKKDYILHCV